jgi:hypothetical protein
VHTSYIPWVSLILMNVICSVGSHLIMTVPLSDRWIEARAATKFGAFLSKQSTFGF